MTDQLGPSLDRRLRAELDRARPPTPRPENARFSLAIAGYRPFGGLKPALAVAAALPVLMVAATVASGSPNPSVWTQDAVNSIESVTQSAPTSPSPEPREQPPEPAPAHPEPSETTEPSHESPEPRAAPSPSSEDGHWGSPSPSPSPSHEQ